MIKPMQCDESNFISKIMGGSGGAGGGLSIRIAEEAHPQASLPAVGAVIVRQRTHHLVVGIRHGEGARQRGARGHGLHVCFVVVVAEMIVVVSCMSVKGMERRISDGRRGRGSKQSALRFRRSQANQPAQLEVVTAKLNSKSRSWQCIHALGVRMFMYIRGSRCKRVGTWPGRGGYVVGREKKREGGRRSRRGKGSKSGSVRM